MKKRFSKLLFLVALVFTISFSASAQIYVTVRPKFPVIVRPPQPSPVHIWINEEWEPDGNSYKYSGGHWAPPPHSGYYRRPGYWKSSPRGLVWVNGNWYQKKPKYYGKSKGKYKHKDKDKD